MIVLFRALTYGTLFVGLLLVFVPDRILTQAGIVRPPVIGPVQIAGMLVVVAGAALAIASVLTFAFVGKGTPAPFDPPRRLVISGPYRWVRNPMYLGMGIALTGEAIVFPNLTVMILVMVALLFAVVTLSVIRYEERTLRQLFGADY